MSRQWKGADAKAAASENGLLAALLSLSAMLLLCWPMSRVAMAADGHDFQICSGYFALCAASTCQAIKHKTITVNVTGDGTAEFPQADCTCPIFSGHAIADVTGGNMKGSCEPPAPGKIWSLYSVRKEIPQAPEWDPATAAPPQVCPKSTKQHPNQNQVVNCFSFLCDTEKYINGVPVVTCHCPIGESLAGTFVAPGTAFVTQAGQGDEEVCAELPVGGPISLP
jgi:hypothetical protein